MKETQNSLEKFLQATNFDWRVSATRLYQLQRNGIYESPHTLFKWDDKRNLPLKVKGNERSPLHLFLDMMVYVVEKKPEQRIIWLFGPPGVGKTMLSQICGFLLCCALDHNGYFVEWSTTLNKMKTGFSNGNTVDIQAELDAPILILDDVGQERGTDWEREILYTTINQRRGKYLTIVTSNLSLNGNYKCNGVSYTAFSERFLNSGSHTGASIESRLSTDRLLLAQVGPMQTKGSICTV